MLTISPTRVFLMERYSDQSHVNIGWGEDVSIAELATLIAEIVGFKGRLRYATEKPDGMPRKLLDVSQLSGGIVGDGREAVTAGRGIQDI